MTAYAAGPAAAQFASNVNLLTLDGTTGFRVDGVAANHGSGGNVAAAGDVNGDGIDDFIIGAPDVNNGAFTFAGAVYVVFGRTSAFPSALDLSSLDGSNGFSVLGESQSGRIGEVVGRAGDVNGDGYDDILIGAPNLSPGGRTYAGATYVMFGKQSGFSAINNVSTLNGSNGFRLEGATSYDKSATDVSGAGDVNGDGFDDIIVGAYGADGHGDYTGAAYVVFGKASGFESSLNFSALTASKGFRLVGVSSLDRAGRSVSGAGDMNGDGFDDVVVGAQQGIPTSSDYQGAAYVVFGKATGFGSSLELSSLNGASGFALIGQTSNDRIGYSVAGVGDYDGDGYDDILVGAPSANKSLPSETGESYLVYGKSLGFTSVLNVSSLDGLSGLRLTGVTASGDSGSSVAGLGDLTGDGFADLLIGDPATGSDGVVYAVFGEGQSTTSNINLSSLNGPNGFRLSGTGVPVGDGDGSIAGAGDVNGDGFADILVGDPNGNDNGNDSGSTYVVFGRAPTITVVRSGTAATQYISGGAKSDVIWGPGDTLEGRGSPDLLIGPATASYEHATAKVTVDLKSPGNNRGEAEGDAYLNITKLIGSAFDDTLTGDDLGNRLTGGKGRDRLKGGKGKDTFVYSRVFDSPVGLYDTITDFEPKSTDKIDLSAIDANTGKGGNQAFDFIGTKSFSKAGQLRVKKSGKSIIVQGNISGSSGAEFEIKLDGLTDTSKFGDPDFKL